MWRGHEFALASYAMAICDEWTGRGYKDTCKDKIANIIRTQWHKTSTEAPSWINDRNFHASHRSNLLRKDPIHYGQFGWTEKDDLPYVWPV
jgi:hypothetical protein